jgi:NitT/TauT family transport system permease protein
MSVVTTARIKAPLRFRGLGAAAEKPIDALWRMAKRSLAIVLLCAAWEISPRLGLVDRVFLPRFPR